MLVAEVADEVRGNRTDEKAVRRNPLGIIVARTLVRYVDTQQMKRIIGSAKAIILSSPYGAATRRRAGMRWNVS
jgi:hypothetical protein